MKTKIIILLIITASLFISSCNSPEIIIFDKMKLKEVKVIQLNLINVRSITYDPFIKRDLADLVKFELEKSGYILIEPQPLLKTISSNTLSSELTSAAVPDALLELTFAHRKYYKNIDEYENVNIQFLLLSPGKEKICSVMYSETDDDNLLNSEYLKTKIAEIIKTLKD